MRADIRTEVTLDTVVRIPNRYVYCDTAFLICGGTGRCGAIHVVLKCRYRKIITLLSVYCSLNSIDELNNIGSSLCCMNHIKAFVLTVLPALGNLNFMNALCAGVNGSPVLLNNILALAAVSCLRSSLH